MTDTETLKQTRWNRQKLYENYKIVHCHSLDMDSGAETGGDGGYISPPIIGPHPLQ